MNKLFILFWLFHQLVTYSMKLAPTALLHPCFVYLRITVTFSIQHFISRDSLLPRHVRFQDCLLTYLSHYSCHIIRNSGKEGAQICQSPLFCYHIKYGSAYKAIMYPLSAPMTTSSIQNKALQNKRYSIFLYLGLTNSTSSSFKYLRSQWEIVGHILGNSLSITPSIYPHHVLRHKMTKKSTFCLTEHFPVIFSYKNDILFFLWSKV